MNKIKINIIIPFYLNQRVVYDTLAIINDGFTELYNISDANNTGKKSNSTISGSLELKGNPLTLMGAKLESELSSDEENILENKKEFTKIHTPTSLFLKIYNYLIGNNQIIQVKTENDIILLNTGDFIEFYSTLSINTIEESLRKTIKMCSIGEIFIEFGSKDSSYQSSKKTFKNIKENLLLLTKYIDLENEKTKYMVGEIGTKKIAVKIERENIINADYDQISNGKFRIIGKVLEVIDNGKYINLNRESVIGMIKQDVFLPVKEAITDMNTMFEDMIIEDEIAGKTVIIVPIIIGI